MVNRVIDHIDSLIKNLKTNEFSSENSIDEQRGIYKVNCSGLVKYLCSKSKFKIYAHKAYEIFEELKPRSYQDIDKLERGDLILWRKNNVPKSGSTGHMAVFLTEVKRDETSITVKVLDASKRPHDNDSRSMSGVGIGEFKLIREKSKPIGFIWSKIDKKTKFTEIIFVKPSRE